MIIKPSATRLVSVLGVGDVVLAAFNSMMQKYIDKHAHGTAVGYIRGKILDDHPILSGLTMIEMITPYHDDRGDNQFIAGFWTNSGNLKVMKNLGLNSTTADSWTRYLKKGSLYLSDAQINNARAYYSRIL